MFGREVTNVAMCSTRIAGPMTGAGDASQRVDLGRVLTGLRNLLAAGEPARVFTDLAGVCACAV